MTHPIPRVATQVPMGVTLWDLGHRRCGEIQDILGDHGLLDGGTRIENDGEGRTFLNVDYWSGRGFDGIVHRAMRVIECARVEALAGFTFRFATGGLGRVEVPLCAGRHSFDRVGYLLTQNTRMPMVEAVSPLWLNPEGALDQRLLQAPIDIRYLPRRNQMMVEGEAVSVQEVRDCLRLLGIRLKPEKFAA